VEPRYFKTPKDFRAWFEKNHTGESELLVGFHKVGTGKPCITWPQSVDEALSFGWIDGVRRSLGAEAYTIRFTPRKSKSIWSSVNIKRMAELIADGRVVQAGLDAFGRRDAEKSEVYSYERKSAPLNVEFLAQFKADKTAWSFHETTPPSYRRAAEHWVSSAKREETRLRRLETLMMHARKGERLPHLTQTRVPAKKQRAT
jgi:uncharacterized protein YdeI (YjbR/CyaY-like superfamily)